VIPWRAKKRDSPLVLVGTHGPPLRPRPARRALPPPRAPLLRLIEEYGPSSETNGLLGRVYKDLWVVEVRLSREPRLTRRLHVGPLLLSCVQRPFLRVIPWRAKKRETAAATNMARRYGRAPRGERCHLLVPHCCASSKNMARAAIDAQIGVPHVRLVAGDIGRDGYPEPTVRLGSVSGL
jgi:hypothetical protein